MKRNKNNRRTKMINETKWTLFQILIDRWRYIISRLSYLFSEQPLFLFSSFCDNIFLSLLSIVSQCSVIVLHFSSGVSLIVLLCVRRLHFCSRPQTFVSLHCNSTSHSPFAECFRSILVLYLNSISIYLIPVVWYWQRDRARKMSFSTKHMNASSPLWWCAMHDLLSHN